MPSKHESSILKILNSPGCLIYFSVQKCCYDSFIGKATKKLCVNPEGNSEQKKTNLTFYLAFT